MNEPISLSMPQELGNNLLLRWGSLRDVDALAEFNVRLHSDDPQQPESWLGSWTRDLMSGAHPTTNAGDFTVVEDTSSGAIVSSQVLISQTWSYDGIPFGVGRPELVATDEAYRRQGLIRRQMAVAHALSAQRGELVQAITGIPWYYRQFGYEMAVNLGGGREYFWTRPGNDKAQGDEPYRVRPAAPADIPILQALYESHCAASLLRHERSDAVWRYQLTEADSGTMGALHAQLVLDQAGEVVAYFATESIESTFRLLEMGVRPGHSWRSVALFVMRELKRQIAALNQTRSEPFNYISIILSDKHPLIIALDRQLEKARNPYSWYVRVPDLPAFIRHIAPVLEKRLAASVMAGHSGQLSLSLYRETLRLTFEEGRLKMVDRFQPRFVEDADALFPDLTFLQLLFGHRSLDALDDAYADCFTSNAGAAVLLRALFPRRPSWINALN